METFLISLLCLFLFGAWMIERFCVIPELHRSWRDLYFRPDKTPSVIAPDKKPLFGSVKKRRDS